MARLVARYTRAWIETLMQFGEESLLAVARYTRAWIETLSAAQFRCFYMSPAIRGRGLKHDKVKKNCDRVCRPLYAGVD